VLNVSYPLLLDGGLSNELEKQGLKLNHPLWTAQLIESHPEAIVEAHLRYLKAGADCILTSSYQASLQGFLDLSYNEAHALKLIAKSVDLAVEARVSYSSSHPKARKPLIGASIGPYGAYLADGSEYRGDYQVNNDVLHLFHVPRYHVLDSSEADFLACETIPSWQEAKVLSKLIEHATKPAWVSFSCKDGKHINDGTPIKQCAEKLSKNVNIFAIGVNCTAPEHISSLIAELKSANTDKRIVVYPNSGEIFHASDKTWSGHKHSFNLIQGVREWLELGADIVGGCCRIGPDEIKQFHRVALQMR